MFEKIIGKFKHESSIFTAFLFGFFVKSTDLLVFGHNTLQNSHFAGVIANAHDVQCYSSYSSLVHFAVINFLNSKQKNSEWPTRCFNRSANCKKNQLASMLKDISKSIKP